MKRLTQLLFDNNIINESEIEIIEFGITGSWLIFVNILTTLLMAALYGKVKEVSVFLISFIMLRRFAGGYHSKSALKCYFLSNGIMLLIIMFISNVKANDIINILIITTIISIIIILKFAPIETVTKPLEKIEKLYFRKFVFIICGIEISLIVLLYLFDIKKYMISIMISMIICALLLIIGIVENRR